MESMLTGVKRGICQEHGQGFSMKERKKQERKNPICTRKPIFTLEPWFATNSSKTAVILLLKRSASTGCCMEAYRSRTTSHGQIKGASSRLGAISRVYLFILFFYPALRLYLQIHRLYESRAHAITMAIPKQPPCLHTCFWRVGELKKFVGSEIATDKMPAVHTQLHKIKSPLDSTLILTLYAPSPGYLGLAFRN